MDLDADGEEVDAEVNVDWNADAELLEAVDAAEANNASDEEWLKEEDARVGVNPVAGDRARGPSASVSPSLPSRGLCVRHATARLRLYDP